MHGRPNYGIVELCCFLRFIVARSIFKKSKKRGQHLRLEFKWIKQIYLTAKWYLTRYIFTVAENVSFVRVIILTSIQV